MDPIAQLRAIVEEVDGDNLVGTVSLHLYADGTIEAETDLDTEQADDVVHTVATSPWAAIEE